MSALPATRRGDAVERQRIDEAERRRQIKRNQRAIALLQSWLEEPDESEEEQRKALDWLMGALDEDRPANRKLYS